MARAFRVLLLASLFASCKPGTYRAEAVFIDGKLAFVDAKGGNFNGGWQELAVLDGEARPIWSFTHGRGGECRSVFPIFYGRPPDGATNTAPPVRPEAGRLYVLVGDLTESVEGAFVLERRGQGMAVRNVDPASPAAAAIRERWWKGRNGGG